MAAISIIIPCYNVEKYIHQCMKSILDQQGVDYEVIAVDDGSPDNCPAILDEYAAKYERFHVIHQPNGGVSAARNRGLEEAQGKWCYFVDSDDWLIKGQLAQAVNYADETDADVVFVDCLERYESGRQKRLRLFSEEFVTDDRYMIDTVQASILCHKKSPYYSPGADSAYPAPWSKIIRTSLIKENGIKFDPYVGGVYDDGLFTLEILEVAQKIAYSGICLYNYRILGTSIVHTYKKGTIEKFEKNCEKVDEFIMRNHKGVDFIAAEYARRIAYLSMMLAVAFGSKGMMTRNEFLEIIGRSPWKEAVKDVDPRLLERKHMYTLACMKAKLSSGLRVYSRLKQIKSSKQ